MPGSVSGLLHMRACERAQPLPSVVLFVILWTVACQAPPSMGFCRKEYWSGLLLKAAEMEANKTHRSLASGASSLEGIGAEGHEAKSTETDMLTSQHDHEG